MLGFVYTGLVINIKIFFYLFQITHEMQTPRDGSQRGGALFLGMLYANEAGLSSGRVGHWLMCACAFTFMYLNFTTHSQQFPGVLYLFVHL